MVLKQVQGVGTAQDWAVIDDNGNELERGTIAEMEIFYNANKHLIIEDTYFVNNEFVNKKRDKKGDALIAPVSFHAKSLDTLVVGATTASSIMTGLAMIGELRGVELDVATQSFKNISGRALQVTGTLAVQIEHTGAQPVEFYIFSERSDDAIVWVDNNESLRKNTIQKDGVDYRTIGAFTDEPWEDGQYIRFRFARDGAGNATLLSTSQLIDGVTVTGHSYNLVIVERD